jgi:hypothetical protein
MKPSRCSIFALWSCAYAVGCTHQVRPDDMSAEAHLAAAEKETRQAQREMASATLDSPARDPVAEVRKRMHAAALGLATVSER